jgi:hypothetical protein
MNVKIYRYKIICSKMTHFYVEIPSEKAFRFLRSVAKWSGVDFDESLELEDDTEFSKIHDEAEKLVVKQFQRTSSMSKGPDVNLETINMYYGIYTSDMEPTNYICRSINNSYFNDGITYLANYPSEVSHVVNTGYINNVYVVRRVDVDTYECMTIFV